MPRSHCCLLIPTTRRSRHNRCWRPIGPHKPGLSSQSEHPFTSSSHLPDFHPLFFLISQFYFHFSFCLLPFTRSLLWFLTLFSTWHSSSLKQVPSFPVQQISPCRSFLFLTSPLPPIYRIRILFYFLLGLASHLFSIILWFRS